MKKTSFFTNKKILIALLLFIFALAAVGVLDAQLMAQAYASEHEGIADDGNQMYNAYRLNDDYQQIVMEHELDEIRAVLNSSGQLIQHIREYCDYEGVITHQVAMTNAEMAYLRNQQFGIQPMSTPVFPYTRIRHSGRSHEDSIVIVIMGDGFNPDQGF